MVTTYLWTDRKHREEVLSRITWMSMLDTHRERVVERSGNGKDPATQKRGQLDELVLHCIASGGTTRGNLDFAIDRGQVVVNGTGADD